MLRKLLIGLMGAIIVLAGALCYKVISENYLVYVVETDIKTGEVRNVGTVASMENYQPTDQVYTYFIRQFVQDIRNVPLDEVVYKNQLKTAYSFLTRDGASVLTNRLQDEKRMEKLGKSRSTASCRLRVARAIRSAGQKSNTRLVRVMPVPLLRTPVSSRRNTSSRMTRTRLPQTRLVFTLPTFVGNRIPRIKKARRVAMS